MIRALVVDDEAPARRKLHELLAAETDIEMVGEAADGVEAVAAIRAAAPDLVFLDIQMPRLDGFGVIAEIGVAAMPLTVFVTAYDEHALRAFEVQALDYLLKPFAPSRFQTLLARVRRHLAKPDGEGSTGDLAGRIESLLKTVRPEPAYLRQLLAEREADRQVVLAVDEIDRIEADGNTLRFFTREGAFYRRGTLHDLENRLDPTRFLRLNRSEIVRLEAIREIQPWFHGDARVILKDGKVLTWSRRYRAKAEGLF
ncbi:MAG TPA: LytTR family transcriptional regulator DNA-binding domain-containing protein [Thermoanaerobaculia bacterium]|nr:LytTR family transcriptional regulator DNA-binding domain-containing protein [Thermoanaerobaculia bacterium]